MREVRTLRRYFGLTFSVVDEDEDGDAPEAAIGAGHTAEAPEVSGADDSRMSGEGIAAAASSSAASGGKENSNENENGNGDEFLLEELEIVFVAWSPSRWELGRSPSIAAAAEYFTALSENFGMSLNLTTWLPANADLAEMEFAIAHKARKWLRKKMLSSLQQSAYKLLDGGLPPPSTPPPRRSITPRPLPGCWGRQATTRQNSPGPTNHTSFGKLPSNCWNGMSSARSSTRRCARRTVSRAR